MDADVLEILTGPVFVLGVLLLLSGIGVNTIDLLRQDWEFGSLRERRWFRRIERLISRLRIRRPRHIVFHAEPGKYRLTGATLRGEGLRNPDEEDVKARIAELYRRDEARRGDIAAVRRDLMAEVKRLRQAIDEERSARLEGDQVAANKGEERLGRLVSGGLRTRWIATRVTVLGLLMSSFPEEIGHGFGSFLEVVIRTVGL